MRYLVTGAAGFIGSHLAETLVEQGHDVVALDSFTDYYDPRRKRENAEGLDVLEADMLEIDLDELLDGVDGVFHLAGQPGVRASFGPDFEHYVIRNVHASGRVFEAAARRSVRVVYASSSSIYGDAESYPTREDAAPRPIAPYGVTKLCVEHLAYAHARTTGLDAVGLRYFTVYGPRQRPDMAFTSMLEALAGGGTFRLYGDGSTSRSFTYVADAVAGTIAALERGTRGEIYNVGGGEEASMAVAITLAEEIAGLNPVVVSDVNIPKVTYSDPEVASVGLTEAKAVEQYGADAVASYDYNLAGNGKSHIIGTSGSVKVVRVKDGPVVGVHMIGARVGELIGEAQLAVNWEAYPEDIAPFIHAHPTQNEALGEAFLAIAGKPLHAI